MCNNNNNNNNRRNSNTPRWQKTTSERHATDTFSSAQRRKEACKNAKQVDSESVAENTDSQSKPHVTNNLFNATYVRTLMLRTNATERMRRRTDI